MRRVILLTGLLLVLSIILIGCNGDDELEIDKIPPTKPILIPHLGDTGDGLVTFDGDEFSLDDNNNGVDAESAHRGFRIMWKPLIYDNDLEKIIINRFMNDDIENITMVDSISAASDNYYIDNSISSDFLHENKFSFFIEVYDRAGNSTMSDTVHYRLSDKVYPTSPWNGQEFTSSNDLTFDWSDVADYNFYRVLLFDNNMDLLWLKDILIDVPDGDTQDFSFATYNGGSLADGNYYWRVDVFKFDYELDEYYYGDLEDSNNKDFYYGSESEIYSFIINRNKN